MPVNACMAKTTPSSQHGWWYPNGYWLFLLSRNLASAEHASAVCSWTTCAHSKSCCTSLPYTAWKTSSPYYNTSILRTSTTTTTHTTTYKQGWIKKTCYILDSYKFLHLTFWTRWKEEERKNSKWKFLLTLYISTRVRAFVHTDMSVRRGRERQWVIKCYSSVRQAVPSPQSPAQLSL